jgi:hypothetical protein
MGNNYIFLKAQPLQSRLTLYRVIAVAVPYIACEKKVGGREVSSKFPAGI